MAQTQTISGFFVHPPTPSTPPFALYVVNKWKRLQALETGDFSLVFSSTVRWCGIRQHDSEGLSKSHARFFISPPVCVQTVDSVTSPESFEVYPQTPRWCLGHLLSSSAFYLFIYLFFTDAVMWMKSSLFATGCNTQPQKHDQSTPCIKLCSLSPGGLKAPVWTVLEWFS